MGVGDGAFLREEAVVDLRLGLGFDVLEDVAVVFIVLDLVTGAGAGFDGPSPGDARRGGLKGSRRRFWAGWRSTGMVAVSREKQLCFSFVNTPVSIWVMAGFELIIRD